MGRPIHRSLHMWTLAGQSVPPRPFSRWDARPAKTNFLKVLTLPAPRTYRLDYSNSASMIRILSARTSRIASDR
jgi:hypothetical protein